MTANQFSMNLQGCDVEARLGYSFARKELLIQALTHKSTLADLAPKERQLSLKGKHWNERLEFLGDSVLGMCMAAKLMELFPTEDEGYLSKRRSLLIREETLARLAVDKLALDQWLRLGGSAKGLLPKQRVSIMADAVEALIGGVFLDGGFEAAKAVVGLLFIDEFEESHWISLDQDHKTKLQELLQSKLKLTPSYIMSKEEGPSHDPRFEVHVVVDSGGTQIVMGTGAGPSKKSASQAAAMAALEQLIEPIDGSFQI
jgi:ribonuclease-3